MPFSAAFTIGASANPSSVVINDVSTGSDVLIVDRQIQLLTVANTPLSGTSVIDFPLSAGSSITINPLTQDVALNVIVSWLYGGNIIQYQSSQIAAFTQYGEQYFYTLIQTMATNPTIINDAVFFENFEKLRVLIDSAGKAITTAGDIGGSQGCILQYQNLISNPVIFF